VRVVATPLCNCNSKATGRRPWAWAVLLVLLVLLSVCAARAEAPKTVVVPFELLRSKHIVVNAKINGKGPYRLIFDTGAPVSIVNSKTARDSGMVDSAPPWLTLFNSLGAVKIKTFELGDLKLEKIDAAVFDHPTVDLIARSLGPIDGVVGFPFFARYRVTLDYQTRKMTLTPSGYDAPNTEAVAEAIFETLTQTNPKPKVLAPAGQWGFVPHKDKSDLEAGVTVKEVMPASAAESAGLNPGDRLLSLGGRWTDSPADTYYAASHIKPGDAAQAVIKRGNRTLTLTITPRMGL
jgi:hypothetical protein